MQGLQSKLADAQLVDFVDACMEARGYETRTAFGDPLCTAAYGPRIHTCYVRPSLFQRVKAKL